MATLRIQKANAIIFELLRRDLAEENSVFEEVKVVSLAVKPSSLRYEYGSRVAITQTVPDRGFVDRFGMRLTKVTMSGTFGLKPRREGIAIKDGVTRLLEFRDEIFKLSQQARQKEADTGHEYIYALNYYDFIWDERFAVNLDTFIPEVSARRNPFEPVYQLSFTSIGPVFVVIPKDPILAVLLAIDELLTSGTDALNNAVEKLSEVELVQQIAEMVGALDTLGDVRHNLIALGSQYAAAIAGQLNSIKSANIVGVGANPFALIKG
jgi:hypothetical protein